MRSRLEVSLAARPTRRGASHLRKTEVAQHPTYVSLFAYSPLYLPFPREDFEPVSGTALSRNTGNLYVPITHLIAKEEGVPISLSHPRRAASAVEEVVRGQADVGVDGINDGEMSKPSYATCFKDTARRLSMPHYFLVSLQSGLSSTEAAR
ncbi:MAG TPA: hypothetical protein VGK75_16955 [Casimicrobiaceae bacterium]